MNGPGFDSWQGKIQKLKRADQPWDPRSFLFNG